MISLATIIMRYRRLKCVKQKSGLLVGDCGGVGGIGGEIGGVMGIIRIIQRFFV